MRNVRVSSPYKDSGIQALSILGTAISTSDHQRHHGEGREGKEVGFSALQCPSPRVTDTMLSNRSGWLYSLRTNKEAEKCSISIYSRRIEDLDMGEPKDSPAQ